MAREEGSAAKTAEIKQLVATGDYRIDPVAVADAMIRRGMWGLWAERVANIRRRPLPRPPARG